jgi:glycosyltransferase involved in cell wall biosynthesis
MLDTPVGPDLVVRQDRSIATTDCVLGIRGAVTSSLRVNHVLSSDVDSLIFNHIFNYFRRHSPGGWEHVVSVKPIDDADVWHYHRPHLETVLRTPSVVTVHHDLLDTDPWLALDKFLPRYREASMVVCLNHGQTQLLALHGITQTRVVHHGFNPDVLLPVLGRAYDPSRPFRLGFFSKRYDQRFKGEAHLMDIAKRLDPARAAFTLAGAGRSYDAIELSALGFQVRFFERLPYRVFGSLYASIDALLMLSNFEGGPANVPEALATATPIVCTPVGMVPDVVTDGVDGLIMSGDPDRDAERISALAANENGIADKLFGGAAAGVRRATSWEQNVTSYLQIYTSIAAHKCVYHAN